MPVIKLNGEHYELFGVPNECPFCHQTITPEPKYIHFKDVDTMQLLLVCPNLSCRHSFIGYYHINDDRFYFQNEVSFGSPKTAVFSDYITNISPYFIKIYNEAQFSEQHNLFEICGVGYRKALEFLIKDYCSKKHTENEDLIKSKPLGSVIQEFVNDERIKGVAKRAVWLGNDETHYVRKWENKTLEDMKKLITLTVHWIEMEELTNSFSEEMPG